MEAINKRVLLEPYVSRENSLIPYIGNDGKPFIDDNGNWGKIPCDIDICKCSGYEALKTVFGGDENSDSVVVPFSAIMSKKCLFVTIITNSQYYKRVIRNGKNRWFPVSLNYGEKKNISIVSQLPEDDSLDIAGLYIDNSFDDNGGLLMASFIDKVLGLFVVPQEYITADNTVPEIMRYAEIKSYLEKMDKYRGSDDCCISLKYKRLGGDEFYAFLQEKATLVPNEINYWMSAVTDDAFIGLPILISSDYHGIGTYTTVSPLDSTDDRDVPDMNTEIKTVASSKLYEFRAKPLRDDNDNDCPFYLQYNSDTKKYTILPLYKVGKVNNFNGVYGDLITKMTYSADYAYVEVGTIKVPDDEIDIVDDGYVSDRRYGYGNLLEESGNTPYPQNQKCYTFDGKYIHLLNYTQSSGTVEIEYVIEGKLIENDGNWIYDTDSRSGIVYKETVEFITKDILKENLEYYQIVNGYQEKNILGTELYIDNIRNALIIGDSNGEAEIMTIIHHPEGIRNDKVIMMDEDFGTITYKMDDNINVNVDRGIASEFELIFKLGEINTYDDMAHYQNNIFGLV